MGGLHRIEDAAVGLVGQACNSQHSCGDNAKHGMLRAVCSVGACRQRVKTACGTNTPRVCDLQQVKRQLCKLNAQQWLQCLQCMTAMVALVAQDSNGCTGCTDRTRYHWLECMNRPVNEPGWLSAGSEVGSHELVGFQAAG